ncbi:tripartite tricarboxylate transporter substrate binding protein [Pseudoroseomonas wenyumeiae]|uniref:Tripartite tricarboxylate transporter substrate binding protein n=1 Tax=Teichococcus wenyumeiae TaxID=2478470 RepID=A0A3A9J6S1_9PROT|nr:tripartite tricarboxylate transporter substrate binding protein [Pseudoroseomonas wenyumeiae]RKK02152.1 tripartite tricarboxylate transporter substrate binding protein [Pseudoroseomonas wenyumeiae]RMI15272.1 tripartite tricarboxylate transporter substrate binding protein [Pseudoroseomonas wenyumeiae]
MKTTRRSMLALAAVGGLARPALAQPGGRPVLLIVPFAPGGPTDLIARRLALGLGEPLGQVVVVENRPGAGGNIGAEFVARSAPDGQTILFGTSGPLAINRMLYPDQTYDPVKDFAPIAPLGRIPNVLAVNARVPARTVPELVALAKKEKLSFGSSGNGASSHLAGALFNRMAGTNIEHIPYKGTGPALNDLLAGHVAMVFTDVLTALPHIQGGRVRGLGVTTLERSAVLPDLPTVAEQGLHGNDASVFFGLTVAIATPEPVRERLRGAFVRAVGQLEIRRFLESQGMQVAPDLTGAALSSLMETERARWARVIQEASVRAD